MIFPELKIASLLFMAVLLVWSLIWIYFAVARLRTTSNSKVYWQTHLLWSLVNLIIAGYSMVSTLSIDSFSSDRAMSLRNIVAVNILLDIVYIVVAVMLQRSQNATKQGIGRAVFIQGMFLLLLDTVIVVTFMFVMTK